MALQKQRAVAAIVGGFVADAATMGLHWIYDPEKLSALIAAAPAPEFHEPPACPFYSYESGALSPYGAEVTPLLEFVAAKGSFEPSGYGDASYHAAKSYTGRLNGVFRELVKKGDAGEKYPNLATENNDLHGGIKTPVLVAKYLGDTAALVAKTKEATQVHQIGVEATDAAVACALLLQQVVEGTPIPAAVAALTTSDHIGAPTRSLVQAVVDAVANKTFPDAIAAVNSFGKACPLPGSLQGALYVLLTTSGYTAAVRANIAAGGDNCSRAMLIGAIAAAAAVQDVASADPVPAEWKAKATDFDLIQQLAQQLVQ
jgi:hypothetical protein